MPGGQYLTPDAGITAATSPSSWPSPQLPSMTIGQLFSRLRDRPRGRGKHGDGDWPSTDGRGAPDWRGGSRGGRVFVACTLLLVVVTVLWVALIKPPTTARVSIP